MLALESNKAALYLGSYLLPYKSSIHFKAIIRKASRGLFCNN